MKTTHENGLSADSADAARVGPMLRALATGAAEEAWAEFLSAYSPLILQVARLFGRDADQVDECFLFVCERLARNRFHRLRRFRPEGPARFSTWLRAVARNLCLDWHRKRFGRQRVFESVARLSGLDREVFRLVFERGHSLDEALDSIRPRFPTVGREQLAESWRRVQDALSPRQMWLLSARRSRVETLAGLGSDQDATLLRDVPDPRPDPESLAVRNEQRAALARALSRLPKEERLLIRLRFGEGLTLAEVARLTGCGTAQAVDRRIQGVLKRLREEIAGGRQGKNSWTAV